MSKELDKTFEELQNMADFKDFGVLKCTLRKVAEGIVATVDKRPTIGDWYINIAFKTPMSYYKSNNDFQHFEHTIIASTFGVGKELVIDINGVSFNLPPLAEDELIEYEYTETETSIIIQL